MKKNFLSKNSLPRHIGIIMDGNGRWAKLRGLPRSEGHKKGVEITKEIIKASIEIGIKFLSFYAFSTENWLRPKKEIFTIMNILESNLKNELGLFLSEKIRFKVIGNREKLKKNIRSLIENFEKATESNDKLTAIFAISYSGRDEIVRAMKKLQTLNLNNKDISEEMISTKLLDTAYLPDPDLIIRTSGEKRISNFLIWQAAYSEFYFTDTLWPDFTKEELLMAIKEYQLRTRRFGKV